MDGTQILFVWQTPTLFMTRRPAISVIGDASLIPDSEKYVFARTLGCSLVENGYRIITGGLGGVMEAASAGAHASPHYREGDVIGMLPGADPNEANQYVDIALATGIDHARNFIVANSDAVIAIGGGAGTLSELSYAWVMHRLILAYECPHPGPDAGQFSDWSGIVAGKRLDDKIRYPEIPEDRIYGIRTADEALLLLKTLLPRYVHRPMRAGKR